MIRKRAMAGLEVLLGAAILLCVGIGIVRYFCSAEIPALKREELGNVLLGYATLFYPFDLIMIFDGIDRWTSAKRGAVMPRA